MAVLFSKKTKNLPSPKPKPNRSEWCIFAWFSQLWFVVMDNFTSLTRSNDDKLYETPIINSHNFIFLQFPPPKKTPQNWSEQCEVINIHSMTCANTNNWDTIYFQLKNNPSQFTLWEEWINEDALNQHFQAEHTKAYLAQSLTDVIYIEKLEKLTWFIAYFFRYSCHYSCHF